MIVWAALNTFAAVWMIVAAHSHADRGDMVAANVRLVIGAINAIVAGLLIGKVLAV